MIDVFPLRVFFVLPFFFFPVDVQPPHSVKVDAKTEHSLSLSWSAPQTTTTGPKVLSYSVSYFIPSGTKDVLY